MRTLVWFRGNDLRLGDHLPLATALKEGEIILAYVLDPEVVVGSAASYSTHRLQFLCETLADLEQRIAERGSTLLQLVGNPREVIPWLAECCRASQIYAMRQTDPVGRDIALSIEKRASARLRLFDGETLVTPGSIRTKAGAPYSVFGAFARAIAEQMHPGVPIPRPQRLPALPQDVARWLSNTTQRTKPVHEIYRGVSEMTSRAPALRAVARAPAFSRRSAARPTGGERRARQRLKTFLDGPLNDYESLRDRADLDGTSRLSADLKFGAVSVRRVWTLVTRSDLAEAARTRFLSQLIWREFAHSTLWDRPELLERPFQEKFEGFPWKHDERAFMAWVEGRTGYPLVDAAANQLRSEGFVHNRARMVAASFLAKDLMVDFRWGERHYLDCLIDGDVSQNDLGWQWSAGTGCDAQPYFRIFNPVTQAEKIDPEGNYVRRYLPQLARLSARYIHAPWLAPRGTLAEAGITIGRQYPPPCVDHAGSRNRFLAIAAEHFAKSR